MDSPMSTIVDNLKLELLKCLISFCLQVYYFVVDGPKIFSQV